MNLTILTNTGGLANLFSFDRCAAAFGHIFNADLGETRGFLLVYGHREHLQKKHLYYIIVDTPKAFVRVSNALVLPIG